MTGPSPLADACPQCPPGDLPATLPASVTPDGESIRARYRDDLGHEWDCWWDPEATGWPLRRETGTGEAA
jgi:hypothetical protein